jgi:Septum formation
VSGRLGVLLAVLVLALTACSGDDGAADATVPPPTTAANVPDSLYDLGVGDCFNGLDADQDLRIRVVPCDRRHQAEVYGVVTVDNRRFPGADVLQRQVATRCAQGFAGYTGEPSGPGTEVAFTEVLPTLASFSAGDRRALCVALGLDGAQLRGSIAQGTA